MFYKTVLFQEAVQLIYVEKQLNPALYKPKSDSVLVAWYEDKRNSKLCAQIIYFLAVTRPTNYFVLYIFVYSEKFLKQDFLAARPVIDSVIYLFYNLRLETFEIF